MTRKDYILIADAFAAANKHHTAPVARAALYFAASELGAVLSRDNPRFDYERFLKACGVQS